MKKILSTILIATLVMTIAPTTVSAITAPMMAHAHRMARVPKEVAETDKARLGYAERAGN